MTECSGCGDCCERFWLDNNVVARFMAYSSAPRTHSSEVAFTDADLAWWCQLELVEIGSTSSQFSCPRLTADRRCSVYDERPAVCRGYPWYGGPPRPFASMSPRCSFVADVRTMLPIVAVT